MNANNTKLYLKYGKNSTSNQSLIPVNLLWKKNSNNDPIISDATLFNRFPHIIIIKYDFRWKILPSKNLKWYFIFNFGRKIS